MTFISKFFALAVLGAGATLISLSSPSIAQEERSIGLPVPECCAPAQQSIVTTAAPGVWSLTLPNNSTQSVQLVSSHPSWPNTLPGSQWISNTSSSGTTSQPPGDYVYSYHFCLCERVPGIREIAATMQLRIYSDNAPQEVKLNNQSIGGSTDLYSFLHVLVIPSVPAADFLAGDNILTIKVNNQSGPTGLDVAGSVSGYFAQLPHGKCPKGH